MLYAIKHITDNIFFFQKIAHWCTCTVHATQSSCCGAHDFLSPEQCLTTAPTWTHWLQDSGSHTTAWLWVVSQKDWRYQAATGWILAMHWYSIWVKKCDFRAYPFCQVMQKHVIWASTVKRLLIAYFISNTLPKNIKMHSCVSKLQQGRFLRQCIVLPRTVSGGAWVQAPPQKLHPICSSDCAPF